MPSPVRFGLVAALAIACHGASAQTVVPPAVSVQRIAPQNPPSPAVQVQSNAAAGATTSTSPAPSSPNTAPPGSTSSGLRTAR